ncbi:MAG: LytR C-terminal domain-containing protein [bacterium]|nr:LytR C-terminal domain-containing protein [bacterium]
MFKNLKIVAAVFLLFLGAFLSQVIINNGVYQKLKNNQDISILFISTHKNKFYGAYLLHYSQIKNVVFIANISSMTRFLKHQKDNKPLYLQDLYQRIYYQSKRKQKLTLTAYLKELENIYEIKIDHYFHFEKDQLPMTINSDIFFSARATDEAILNKYLNVRPFLSKLSVISYLRSWKDNIFDTSLNKLDIFNLLNNVHAIYSTEIIFMGFHNIVIGDDKFYLRDIFQTKNIPNNEEPIVEVLNASGVQGQALTVSRNLREQGVDVQRWGNYAKILRYDFLVAIDRSGDWKKTLLVVNYLKEQGNEVVWFFKKNTGLFVDVSVILTKG